MKFLKNKETSASLDLIFYICPLHIVAPNKQLKGLGKRQHLEILTDYFRAKGISPICKDGIPTADTT